jgi:hypothetical protein
MARRRTANKTRARAARPQAVRAATAAAAPHVVYVHGICRHEAGFSDRWWAVLKPFVPDVPDDNRHEVVWSDLITAAAPAALAAHAERTAAAARGLARPFADPARPPLAEHIKDLLADRAQRQLVEAAVRTARPEAAAAPSAAALPTFETAAPQAFLTIPGLECVDDFVQYLLDGDTRDQVIGRFTTVVGPLVAAGNRVEVISHSWGTVVAYEALRRLDGSAGDGADGPVSTLFTVGSALSILPVQRSLLPEAADGARPRLVQTWVNLNARFDIVGGQLRGVFAVDDEYLDLAPVGCSTLIPNPVCAHSSYFNRHNDVVNRDIFAHYIER